MRHESFNETQIAAGYITLRDMQHLQTDCRSKAEKLRLELRWSIRGHHTRASIMHERKIIWQQKFTANNFPFNLCIMYEKVHQKLTELTRQRAAHDARRAKEHAEREQEKRIAAMPSWGENIKKQAG